MSKAECDRGGRPRRSNDGIGAPQAIAIACRARYSFTAMRYGIHHPLERLRSWVMADQL